MFFGDSERLTSALPWPIDEWKLHYPYWDEPNMLAQEQIGDCYAMVVDTILTLEAPYPGDPQYNPAGLRPELRFYVKRIASTLDYVIRDRLTDSWFALTRNLLEDLEFDVIYWYAEKRSRMLGLTGRISQHCCIGNPVSIIATKLLTDGIASSYGSYPCSDPQLDPSRRFHLWRTSN